MQANSALQVRQLEVSYGPTRALAGIDLDFHRGEVHALVGENGAGKSTLLRVLAGLVRPSRGTVQRGTASLAWVPQEISLPDDLTVSEWIFLGAESRTAWRTLRRGAMHRAAKAILGEVGSIAAPRAALGDLAPAQRKLVQIAHALHRHPEVLLLDEPTAVLGEQETQRLFGLIRILRDAGTAVVYVSHRLEEVLRVADRVTVLRDGLRVSTDSAAAVDSATLVRRMVGRDIVPRVAEARRGGAERLHVERLIAAPLSNVSLTVHAGEIVGLAGLVGAGRSELLETICGLRRVISGSVRCQAPPLLVPEDRVRQGLIEALNLRENVFLPVLQKWLRPVQERRALQPLWEQLNIRAAGPETNIASLSGGNQQKVLLARVLRRQPQLLLLDEPTAGVDVGVKAEIHALVRQLAAAGTGVLLASSDLPELLHVCDRVIAMRNGAVVGVMPVADADETRLAALITGAHAATAGGQ